MNTRTALFVLALAAPLLLAPVPVTAQQAPLTADDLKASRPVAANEQCDEFVTGQFYFKICDEIEVTVTKYRTVQVDKKCVVYDPIKCCNVIVTKKVDVREPYQDTEMEPRERVFCKTFRVRLDQLLALPDCQCDPSEFLKQARAATPAASTAPAASPARPAAKSASPPTPAEVASVDRNPRPALPGPRRATNLVPVETTRLTALNPPQTARPSTARQIAGQAAR